MSVTHVKQEGARGAALYVLDRNQLACMASPARQDIVDHLAAHDASSIKELAAAIGRKPSAVYHHLNQLLDAGLVIEAGSRVVNRKTENLYTTPSRRMRLKKALEDPSNDSLMGEIVAALTRQAERDFQQGMKADGAVREGAHANLGFFRLVNRPSPAALAQINAKLDEISEILWRDPDPTAPVVALTWVMAPKSE